MQRAEFSICITLLHVTTIQLELNEWTWKDFFKWLHAVAMEQWFWQDNNLSVNTWLCVKTTIRSWLARLERSEWNGWIVKDVIRSSSISIDYEERNMPFVMRLKSSHAKVIQRSKLSACIDWMPPCHDWIRLCQHLEQDLPGMLFLDYNLWLLIPITVVWLPWADRMRIGRKEDIEVYIGEREEKQWNQFQRRQVNCNQSSLFKTRWEFRGRKQGTIGWD